MYFIKYIAGINTSRKKLDCIALLARAFNEITDIKIKLVMGRLLCCSVVHNLSLHFPFLLGLFSINRSGHVIHQIFKTDGCRKKLNCKDIL